MSAKRSDRPRALGRATVLIAVVIYQCSFAVATCDYGLLRMEGLMVVMGLSDGGGRNVRALELHLSANCGRSREVAAWRGQRDEPLSPSSSHNNIQ